MTQAGLAASFIEGSRGKIFVVLRHPAGRNAGPAVLVVPAFAEEMNKCRRMVTEVARELATRGIATLIPDLYGTGDSEGEFAAADCTAWLEDLHRIDRWSSEQGWDIGAFLGARAGCVLGARYARHAAPRIRRCVLWQPVTEGERFLSQFLRLRVAASMMDSDRRESIADLRKMLGEGQSIEVSGYCISPRLASDIDGMVLAAEAGPHLGSVHWMDTGQDAGAPLSGPVLRCIEQLSAGGTAVTVHRSTGAPYWSSVEIVVDQAKVAATVAALTSEE